MKQNGGLWGPLPQPWHWENGWIISLYLRFKMRNFGKSTWAYGCLYKYSIIIHFVCHFVYEINIAFHERHLSGFIATFSTHPQYFEIMPSASKIKTFKIVMETSQFMWLMKLKNQNFHYKYYKHQNTGKYLHFIILGEKIKSTKL